MCGFLIVAVKRVVLIVVIERDGLAQTEWVPSFVKEKRFHNWLEGARDWAISRNRFWGTPLPIWHSADWEEVICVGSIEELYQLSGVRVRPLAPLRKRGFLAWAAHREYSFNPLPLPPPKAGARAWAACRA